MDLTLRVSDLMDPLHGGWNIPLIRELICAGDVELVLKMRFNVSEQDRLE